MIYGLHKILIFMQQLFQATPMSHIEFSPPFVVQKTEVKYQTDPSQLDDQYERVELTEAL